MADDARISTALPFHPKTRKLHKRLGSPGCWSLVCLFLWTANNRSDGNLGGMSDEDIELAAEWDGDAGGLVRTLCEVGFLDGVPCGYTVHDWAEHNPWAATRGQRIERAKQAAAIRWRGRSDADCMPDACGSDAERMRETETSNAHHPTQPTTNPEHKTSLSEVESTSDLIGDFGASSEKRKAPQKKASEDAEKLATIFKDEILRNKPDYKITVSQLRNWAVIADRMMRLDGRTKDGIAELIRWVQWDDFWRTNVLSMDKLREKFDQLEMKRANSSNGSPPKVGRSAHVGFDSTQYTVGLEQRPNGSYSF